MRAFIIGLLNFPQLIHRKNRLFTLVLLWDQTSIMDLNHWGGEIDLKVAEVIKNKNILAEVVSEILKLVFSQIWTQSTL